MLRFSSAISLGLGLILVVPALSMQQGGDDLRRALSETTRALAVLGGLEKSVKTLPPADAVEIVRSATEPAFGDEHKRDEQLQQLRKDVGRLQMAHDEIVRASGGAVNADAYTHASDGSANGDGTTPSAGVSITTGLDDHQRAQFSSEPLLPRMFGGDRSNDSTPAVKDVAADVLRQGQALYRAGKYKEALVLLRSIDGDVRAKYWLARTLEKLDRLDEALDLYHQVEAAKDAGYLAARAKNDAEFLEWKRDFAAKLEKDAKKAPAPTGTPKPASGDSTKPVPAGTNTPVKPNGAKPADSHGPKIGVNA